jgi:hypothetical protein
MHLQKTGKLSKAATGGKRNWRKETAEIIDEPQQQQQKEKKEMLSRVHLLLNIQTIIMSLKGGELHFHRDLITRGGIN